VGEPPAYNYNLLFWLCQAVVHFVSVVVPSVLWQCWLGVRKSIRPVKKLSDEVLMWLSLWSKAQIVCIWSSWFHCHPQTPSSFASFKSRLVLPFWYWLTQVVREKRPLNGCSICFCWVLIGQCSYVCIAYLPAGQACGRYAVHCYVTGLYRVWPWSAYLRCSLCGCSSCCNGSPTHQCHMPWPGSGQTARDTCPIRPL